MLKGIVVLNIWRAFEASIDSAMHHVSKLRLSLPKTSRDVFEMLAKGKIIEASLATSLMNIVGFRNVAVQDYLSLDINILQAMIGNYLDDFRELTKVILELEKYN